MVDMVFGWLVHPDECQNPTNTEKLTSLLKVFHQVIAGTSRIGKVLNKTKHMVYKTLKLNICSHLCRSHLRLISISFGDCLNCLL